MAISRSELTIIINSLGWITLQTSKIESMTRVMNGTGTQQEKDNAETELRESLRVIRRLMNTVFTRNTITSEPRTFSDTELENMRIKPAQ